MHEKVNEEIGTDYRSINDLIRALTQFANPKLKEKISSSSASGRRVTISMTKDLFEDIKSKLANPNPNKAAIARETGASVVQVRKVASGGYDAKFSGESGSDLQTTLPSKTPKVIQPEESKPEKIDKPVKPNLSIEEESAKENTTLELPPISPSEEPTEEPAPLAPPPAPSLDLPPVPAAPEPISPPPLDESVSQEESPVELPPISPSEEPTDEPAPLAPPPAPSLDLPPVPTAPEPISPPSPDEPVTQEESSPELPPIAPPSMGEEIAEEPAPPSSSCTLS